MAFHNDGELNPFDQVCYFGLNLWQRGMNYNVAQMSVSEVYLLPNMSLGVSLVACWSLSLDWGSATAMSLIPQK